MEERREQGRRAHDVTGGDHQRVRVGGLEAFHVRGEVLCPAGFHGVQRRGHALVDAAARTRGGLEVAMEVVGGEQLHLHLPTGEAGGGCVRQELLERFRADVLDLVEGGERVEPHVIARVGQAVEPDADLVDGLGGAAVEGGVVVERGQRRRAGELQDRTGAG